MELYELACDRESQSRTVMRSGRRGIDLCEFAEHELVVIPRNASAVVADFYQQLLLVSPPARQAYPDAPTVGREFDRVSYQVAEHVTQLVAIGVNRRQIVTVQALDSQPLFGRERLVEHAHLIDDFGYREFSPRKFDLVAFAANVGQNLVDHVEELLAAIHDSPHALALLRI